MQHPQRIPVLNPSFLFFFLSFFVIFVISLSLYYILKAFLMLYKSFSGKFLHVYENLGLSYIDMMREYSYIFEEIVYIMSFQLCVINKSWALTSSSMILLVLLVKIMNVFVCMLHLSSGIFVSFKILIYIIKFSTFS